MPDMGTGAVAAASPRGAVRRDKREHLLASVRERGVQADGIGRGPVTAAASPQVTQRLGVKVPARRQICPDLSRSEVALPG
jgi:hypothetical protein